MMSLKPETASCLVRSPAYPRAVPPIAEIDAARACAFSRLRSTRMSDASSSANACATVSPTCPAAPTPVRRTFDPVNNGGWVRVIADRDMLSLRC